MKTVKELAALIYGVATDENYFSLYETKLESIEDMLGFYLDDTLKVIDNINKTSLDKMDRAQRLIDLEAKYGIPKTHTIVLEVGYKFNVEDR